MIRAKLSLLIALALCFFCLQNVFAGEKIRLSLEKGKPNVFDFGGDVFEVTIDNYESGNIQSVVYNKKHTIPIEVDILAELLDIEKISETKYGFRPSSLGEEQVFLFDTKTKKMEKLFFDMPYKAIISHVDYENRIIIGYTGYFFRELGKDQTLELYVFSTAKQRNYKIAELRGKFFNVEYLEKTKIRFNNQDESKTIYDYVTNGYFEDLYFQLSEVYQPISNSESYFHLINESNIRIIASNNNQVMNCSVEKKDGISFLQLSENIGRDILEDNLYGQNISGDSKILFLACIAKQSVKNRQQQFFVGYTKGFSMKSNGVFTNSLVDTSTSFRTYSNCTSFLKEKTKSYPVENLCSLADSSPWVEGVSGDGIGEGFTIKNTDKKNYPMLLIMNGYISYDKPYLYKQNNRVKKLKITGLKSGKSKVLDVLDTPHPQTVDISFITDAEDLRVEIADVYKGTKYDDTCIHFLITWDTEVVPYETSVE